MVVIFYFYFILDYLSCYHAVMLGEPYVRESGLHFCDRSDFWRGIKKNLAGWLELLVCKDPLAETLQYGRSKVSCRTEQSFEAWPAWLPGQTLPYPLADLPYTTHQGKVQGIKGNSSRDQPLYTEVEKGAHTSKSRYKYLYTPTTPTTEFLR